MFDIKDKTVLITGSTRGLGNSFAYAYAKAGCKVILHGRDEARLLLAKEKFEEEFNNVYSVCFDINDYVKVKEGINYIENTIGPIDILVNNAGVQKRHEIDKFPDEEIDLIINTNLKAPIYLSKYVSKYMKERKSGKIINICSLNSEFGRKTIVPYAASKGGVKMLTKALATELAEYNIQVNGLGPGYFITKMTTDLEKNKEFSNWLINRTPAKRWGLPEELWGSLIFLSSPASDFVNGQILYVDGGIFASI